MHVVNLIPAPRTFKVYAYEEAKRRGIIPKWRGGQATHIKFAGPYRNGEAEMLENLIKTTPDVALVERKRGVIVAYRKKIEVNYEL